MKTKALDTEQTAHLREELDCANAALAEERAEKERAQADAATLRGAWLAMKNERDAVRRPVAIHVAPGYYNDIGLAPYLSHGVWRYQIVGTGYKGDEARINVDPDTLIRFASEALAAAVADKAKADGYWTRPWADQ